MKRIAIVTGASSGMGQELIRQIACRNDIDEIWAIARRTDKIIKYSLELAMDYQVETSKVVAMPFDLLNKEHRVSLKTALEKDNPDIILLGNAAGIGFSGSFEELAESEMADTVELNCTALTELTHMCLPYMKNGAKIIQFASAAAFMPQPGFAVYAATKAYVLSFSRALGRELKGRGISVTAVCPGPVKTEFIDSANKGKELSAYKKLVMAEPEKVVAKAVKDAEKGRSMSVFGLPMKCSMVLSKLLPHGLLMRFFG